MTMNNMNDDQWFDKFKPVANPNNDSGYLVDDVCYLFSPYNNEDMKKVQDADPECVWTMLDAEDDTVIGAGFTRINAIGYFITELPIEDWGAEIDMD